MDRLERESGEREVRPERCLRPAAGTGGRPVAEELAALHKPE